MNKDSVPIFQYQAAIEGQAQAAQLIEDLKKRVQELESRIEELEIENEELRDLYADEKDYNVLRQLEPLYPATCELNNKGEKNG